MSKFCEYRKCYQERKPKKRYCEFHYKDKKSDIIATIIAIIIVTTWILGNLIILICGALGISGHLDINLVGSISMIVIGSIFGVLPLLKIILRGK